MKTTIKHPYTWLDINFPDNITVSEDLASLNYGQRIVRRRILLKEKEKIGHVIIIDDPNFGTKLTQQDFLKIILVKGLITEFNKETSSIKTSRLEGNAWKIRFKLDDKPYLAHIICHNIPNTNPGKTNGRIIIALWDYQDNFQSLQNQFQECIREIDVKLPEIATSLWQRFVLLTIVSSNILESLLSLIDSVPIYGTRSSTEAMTPMSFIALIVFLVFFYGVYKYRGWGVYGIGILLCIISITGFICLLIVATMSSSSYYYYIPALREGGIHAFLWVLNLILNISAAIIVFIYHERLIKEEME